MSGKVQVIYSEPFRKLSFSFPRKARMVDAHVEDLKAKSLWQKVGFQKKCRLQC